MRSLSFILILLALVVVIRSGKKCRKNKNCSDSECCEVIRRDKTYEKRGAKKGTCKPYTTKGGVCFPKERKSGYCGCTPGLTCSNPPTQTAVPNTLGLAGRCE